MQTRGPQVYSANSFAEAQAKLGMTQPTPNFVASQFQNVLPSYLESKAKTQALSTSPLLMVIPSNTVDQCVIMMT